MAPVDNLISYFQTRHILVKPEWLQKELDQSRSPVNFEQIYLRWLEQDWNLIKEFCVPSLPSELNFNLLNIKKKSLYGPYLVQINHVIDISKPLPMGNQLVEEDEKTNSDNSDDDFDEKENPNFKIQKKKANSGRPEKKKNFHSGPRMLQFCLTDGLQDCIGIEYEPLPDLDAKMTGAKILLQGPLDVYMGSILLRPKNIKIISTKTFDTNQSIQADLITGIDKSRNDQQPGTNSHQNMEQDLSNMFPGFEDNNMPDMDGLWIKHFKR